MTRPGDALTFTIERRTLVYAADTRKVVRFDPPRLVADCPMPSCEWYITGPDSPGGAVLTNVARRTHAMTVHPEAIHAGGLVLAEPPYPGDDLPDVIVEVIGADGHRRAFGTGDVGTFEVES